ncbi:HsdR family type I site-specific deoxyribonuclease [Sphingomonas sp. LY54]|uniref:type I restriction endonuclease subunit R n=1 Tax=Sphingomonas sp. LY54 TaxID=3095343 RepID=UPI002D799061|nr:HsdR family type I site-specific deoxyribonuclease [Sphingomonas sp. LY54]WRP30023.1 HsdR family type I site-specific deoxyribonuclease [Sphingomonas sp. LY54]
MGWEAEDVEAPFVALLQRLGWNHEAGDLDDPSATGRAGFGEVLQEETLRRKLREINPGPDGGEWLDDGRLSQGVAALGRLGSGGLIERNQRVTELLLSGIVVEGLPGWDGGRGQTIRLIDWERPEKNLFTVASQYRVDCLPGFNSAKVFVVPDLVLLVNGIPIAVVECKSPSCPEPLAEAVDQLRRYSNQRRAAGEIDENEGSEALFATAQLLIATSFDEARVGTIGASLDHYAPWKTVVGPDGRGSQADAEAFLGKPRLSEQERLILGMLEKANLLDIIKSFMLFMDAGGQMVKAVCRYQQYRAVNRAVVRLKTGKTRRQHGEHDERGGIIWHTQGSGKSLTMVFLVRKMRADPQLRRFKIIVITDRKDLQYQLSATASLTGEAVEVAATASGAAALAGRRGPGLIFATIQKYRNPDVAGEAPLEKKDLPPTPSRVAEAAAPYETAEGVAAINEDEAVLVLVDEAHRTQAGDLHASLLALLPNCARIGFTGTPIIMGQKKRTHEIFGEFIDRYTIADAEADGATVPILYEGRTARGAVRDGASMDELFEDLFRERTPDEIEAIKHKYATKSHIFEAPALIAEKARDILRHYVINILPQGLKAQLVASSRLAAIRYCEALRAARDDLLAESERLSPEDKVLDEEGVCRRAIAVQAVIRAWRCRELLGRIEFAPIISGSNNDDPAWTLWTDGSAQEQLIKCFKKPLVHDEPGKADPLAFLVVKSMLLTGFDAPIEGVLYLDRPIREAELLQAVARVNRTGHGKQFGIVVDYYGVAKHLKEALAAYSDEDVEGALTSIKDQVPVLRDRHLRVIDLFRRGGLDGIDDVEAAVNALCSERLRAEFAVKLKAFLTSLDAILPRPEGLPYSRDAKTLAYIHARARNRYKDMPQLGRDVGGKVRRLIDEHVISLGIDPKIAPTQLTDANFDGHVGSTGGDRAKASEMEHAIRSHIRKHLDEDPVLYKKLSERLNKILQDLGHQWDALLAELGRLANEIRSGASANDEASAAVPAHVGPFLRTVVSTVARDGTPNALEMARYQDVTVDLVDLIVDELQSNRNIWSVQKRAAQEGLNARLFDHVMRLRPALCSADQAGILTDKLIEQARANHDRLVQL